VASLGLNPSTVVRDASSTGTITLSAPAPNGGLVVPLDSSKPSQATVPANVSVPGWTVDDDLHRVDRPDGLQGDGQHLGLGQRHDEDGHAHDQAEVGRRRKAERCQADRRRRREVMI
jgi:hypothetical protein